MNIGLQATPTKTSYTFLSLFHDLFGLTSVFESSAEVEKVKSNMIIYVSCPQLLMSCTRDFEVPVSNEKNKIIFMKENEKQLL